MQEQHSEVESVYGKPRCPAVLVEWDLGLLRRLQSRMPTAVSIEAKKITGDSHPLIRKGGCWKQEDSIWTYPLQYKNVMLL